MRRDRAARREPVRFLFDRTYSDTLERIATVNRRFQSALLIGCPNPAWPTQLAQMADKVTVTDPGALFAVLADGRRLDEDEERLGSDEFDLCVAIGTLDTVNNVPLALANISASLRPESLFIGAISGGETLPVLRSAMRAADTVHGAATPHIHPRIDGPGLCSLLANIGLVDPVVDIDRVQVAYSSLRSLVGDLRSMAATNVLADRSRSPLNRSAASAAAHDFTEAGSDGRTVETFEILHFAAWTPAKLVADRSNMGEAKLT